MKQIAKFEKMLAKRMDAIAKERDKLDDYISDATELKEHMDEALEDLQRARDAMSRLV